MAKLPMLMEFYVRHVTSGGQTRSVDMVRITVAGMHGASTTPHRIKDLMRVQNAPNSPAAQMSRDIWDTVRPQYEAWKSGQEIPLDGTPIAAWAGLSDAQAKELVRIGLNTIEHVAAADDGIVGRLNLPNPRALVMAAREWLESRDSQKVTDALAAQKAENDDLKAQLDEMRQALLEMQTRPEPEPAKKGKAA